MLAFVGFTLMLFIVKLLVNFGNRIVEEYVGKF